MGIIGVMGDMEKKHIIEKRYTQPHSKFSNLRNSLVSPLASKNTLVERGSKISKSEMGHMGLMRPMENEKGSVEDGSKISKSGRETESAPVESGTRMSNWAIRPFSPSCPSCPLALERQP